MRATYDLRGATRRAGRHAGATSPSGATSTVHSASGFVPRSPSCSGERIVNGGRPEPAGTILQRVARVLQSHQVFDFAFTGGVAVGVWAAPRQTKDVDLCGSLPAEEVDRLLALRDGIRSGPEELPDIVRFRVEDWDVNLFVSKSAYDQECLRRAIAVEIDGVPVRVVTAEDLLIHKVIKLRHDRKRLLQDLADVRAVIDARGDELDWEYIRRWALSEESAWLQEVGRSTDEDLVSRLPAK
jgi:predicted nucleotidyltransferase